MQEYYTPEFSPGVYGVGIKDWNRRMFDAFIPLPQGTSYNAYLVKGKEKTALIDTVNPGFEEELTKKIAQLSDPSRLDYIIMNHAEPDHANATTHLMNICPKAVLITSEKGAEAAKNYFKIPDHRIKTVKDGETLSLGGKTLRFIDAPWLHWPETMFSYLEEDQILFPCDFFGAHTAAGFYDDQVEDLLTLAKQYFGEIMMPFRAMGKKAMEKLAGLSIKIIAPSHGPIYKNPERVLKPYRQWTNGETAPKAVLVYVSMWNSTEKMINSMNEILETKGIETVPYNLSNADLGRLTGDLVDSRAIVLGSPTVLGGMHPTAIYASSLIKLLRPPIKYSVILGSYGWSAGTLKQAKELLGPTNIELVGTLEIKGRPNEEDYQKIAEIGKQLAQKIKKG